MHLLQHILFINQKQVNNNFKFVLFKDTQINDFSMKQSDFRAGDKFWQ